MSVRSVPVTPESCQLQHLQHVLRIGMQATAANTRSNRPVRVSTDFALVPQTSMGRRPLELSRSAETSLVTAISTQRPLVLRSGMSTTDAAALLEGWELRVAQDTALYQMAGGKGQQTLETMWAAPWRLEHDLLDTETINPVVAWLQNAQPDRRRCGTGMELTAPPCAHSRVGGPSDTTPPCVCDRAGPGRGRTCPLRRV